MIYLPKSQPAPACLEVEKKKAAWNYNCGSVLETLRNDFKNKCYLCEFKAPVSINTEHFVPHRKDRDLAFDWNNLFYCCAHCNNTKLAKPEYDNILKCTVAEDGVDTKIRYHINPWPGEKAEFQAVEDTERVNNTVALLREVYNGKTVLKTIEAANLRDALLKEVRKFQDLIFEYFDNSFSEEDKEYLKQKIARELNSASAFTAFKRWIVRDSVTLNGEFKNILEF